MVFLGGIPQPNPIAPVTFQDLPEEILCEISRLAVANRDLVRILNQVCVSMRGAVNDMNSLWHRFSLGYGVREAFAPIIPQF
jgi:hypothetical protein